MRTEAKPTILPFIQALKDESGDVRSQVAEVLERLKNKS